MSKKVFKRGKYYYFRLFVNGKDCWHSTGETNKERAEEIATAKTAATKGEGEIEEFFDALVTRLTALPEKEQPEVRQRLARRLMTLKNNTLAIAAAWQAWRDMPKDAGSVTLANYEGQWRRFEKWARRQNLLHVHEVTHTHTEEYARNLWREKLAPRSYNAHIILLRGIFNDLKHRAGLLDNPWIGIKTLDKQTQGRLNFTPEELTAICAKATGATRHMIGLGLYTGMRLGDVVNLRWADIHPDRIEIMPRKTKRKGKKITLPIHPALAVLLAERRAQVTGDYLFPDERATYARDNSSITQRFQKFLTDCGIQTTETADEHRRQRAVVRKGFHSLRHSFVSLCAMNRVPQVAIQDLVGHGSPAMTALYSHADFDQKCAAIATLPDVMTNITTGKTAGA